MPTPRKTATAAKPAAKAKAPAKPRAKKASTAVAEPTRRTRTTVPYGTGAYDLVIVESPAKAKTINKYLGPNYKVLASYGHVRDLATTKLRTGGTEEVAGIRIADGWKLRYLVDAGAKAAKNKNKKGRRTQKDILDELEAAAGKANRVMLASDPDREGESIAWHIADELNLDPERTFRIRFNEITKNAVQQALTDAAKIDMDRVRAQEARRAMDRVVGFPLSKLLQDKVTMGLSAGRVQSVAVKLIVDREREIEAFVTEEYWKLTALLAPGKVAYAADPKGSKIFAKKKGEVAEPEGDDEDAGATKLPAPPEGSFLSELARWNGAEAKIGNEAEADKLVAELEGKPFVVTSVEQKDRQQRPSPPFTTSSLQIEASNRLRFAASRTMQTAQKLYEGVELDGLGQTALITYMRTDSTRISNDALGTVRTHIEKEFGKLYLPEKANLYASGKGAQEGHECVRPTDVTMTPAKAGRLGLQGDQLKLYQLIWTRFVACQMTPAVYAVTSLEIQAGPGLFRASGRVLKFDGFRKVMQPGGKGDDTDLPPVAANQTLNRLDLFESQHFTQPPPRFNEASLVKSLEKEGIGRPSTYASIIETVQARGYVEQKERRFYATEVGKTVTDLLVAHFPKIMDLKFTSHFEEELDEIETGKHKYEDVLGEFWGPFSAALEKAKTDMPAQRGIPTGEPCPRCGKPLIVQFSKKTGNKFVGCSGYKDDPKCSYIKPGEGEAERAEPTVTDIACPACGKFMVRKEGRFGVFFTCEGAPGCPTTMNLDAEGKVVVTALPTTHPCPKCETNLLLKTSKTGNRFLACPDKKCNYIVDADEAGNPKPPPDTGIKCEKCNSPMHIRTSWRGPFLSCSGYPKCRNAKSINKELKEQLKDILPAMPEKKAAAKDDVPNVEIDEPCPECGGAMRLQKSRFGGRYFLGCKNYPKCKGTAKATPALEAKIAAAQRAVPAAAPA